MQSDSEAKQRNIQDKLLRSLGMLAQRSEVGVDVVPEVLVGRLQEHAALWLQNK